MTFGVVGFEEGEALLTWAGVMNAIESGHRLQRAEIGDTILGRPPDTLLSRSAWIDGMGLIVKTATVFPENKAHGLPTVNGAANLYSDDDGTLDAIIDFHLVTKWKTAADSLLAARHLARPDSQAILIVGAGTVGWSLREAYQALFPEARFVVWNRTLEAASRLAAAHPGTRATEDLAGAVRDADIVTCATMSTEPIVRGEWLRPGQHVDLIGAYRPDMREANDDVLLRSSIFVDCRETTVDHIGELKDPIERGVIGREAIVADFYDIASGRFARSSDSQITLFKNGGGAHLDLMTARHILDEWRQRVGS